MCCAEFIAKYVLIIANFLFSLVGIAIIVLGIVVLINLQGLQEILPINVLYIGLIVVGAVVFIIGFLACCGAIRESRCMLIFYAILVVIILALCIYMTLAVFGFLDTIQQTVDRWIVTAFENEQMRPAFNTLEYTFRCCGTTGANSYATEALPASCCRSTVEQCVAAVANRGCGVMVVGWMESVGGAIGGVLIVVIIIEAVAVILSLFVSHSIKNKAKRSTY